MNDAVDEDEGTALEHAGVASSLNDGNLTTRVDTFGNGTQGTSFAGITWDAPRPESVRNLVLTMATFFDGGWFGVNRGAPGAGGVLTVADLTPEPVVQVTTDGVTWATTPATSTYLGAFTGLAIGGGGVINPSVGRATFTLTTPQSGLAGIRIIGENGGTADGNGFIGVFELAVNATPLAADDGDGDGMDNTWESANGTNPSVADTALDADSDGLSNLGEYDAGTNPQDDDSDDDGVKDGAEVLTHFSDPLDADSDNDTLTDGAEVLTHGSKPATADSDGDGLTDAAEVNTHTTNPALADTDGDNYSDRDEINAGTNPKLASSFPTNIALLGSAIMGVNDAVDANAGTIYAQQGVGAMTSINDGSLTTRVDTLQRRQPVAGKFRRRPLGVASGSSGGPAGTDSRHILRRWLVRHEQH